MSNLTENQRSQIERLDLGANRGTRLLTATGNQRRLFTVLSAIFLVVLGGLTYTAIRVYDGWDHAIVLADMALVFFCVAAWVYPKRRRNY